MKSILFYLIVRNMQHNFFLRFYYYSFMENILHKMSIPLHWNQGRAYASPVIPPPTLKYVLVPKRMIDRLYVLLFAAIWRNFFSQFNSLLPWDFSLRVAKHFWVLNMTQTILVNSWRRSKVFVAQLGTVRAKRIWQIGEILFVRLPGKKIDIH